MAEFMEIRKNEYSKGTVNSLEIRESRKTDAAAMMEIENLVWTASTTPGEIHFASEAAFLLKKPSRHQESCSYRRESSWHPWLSFPYLID